MCVKGGVTLTGWHRGELAEAQHTALTVWGPLFPYSNEVRRAWAQVCSGAPWGTEAVSSALEGPGGSLRQQDESLIAEVRHSTYQDDGWLKIVRGWTWNVFEEACRKPHRIRELFPVSPVDPWCHALCLQEYVIMKKAEVMQWEVCKMLNRTWKYVWFYSNSCWCRSLSWLNLFCPVCLSNHINKASSQLRI